MYTTSNFSVQHNSIEAVCGLEVQLYLGLQELLDLNFNKKLV